MRRQQGMRLDERYVPYLQMAGLYHLARLNDRWFRLDESLVSAFVERWHPETHTFYMPFGECTITLQDVAYQLGLPVDGRYVSGCLTDFHVYIEGGRPAWQWFHELLGVLPPANQIQKFAVNCTWFQKTFEECPEGADEKTVRRFARVYIMMLLGTQLFADKSGNRIHIRSAGYDAFSWPLASRWSGYNPGISEKGPRVQMARLRIDLLQARDVIHMDALQHTRRPPGCPPGGLGASAYDVMAHWHLHWETRADHVLRFDVVDDPGPSHEFLAWWHQHGKRFLSPDMYLGDPRGIPIPVEATQRGAGRVPDMDRVDDIPDRRRVERRARVGTRRSQREWRWLDQAMEEGDEAGRGGGRRRGRGGRRRGAAPRQDRPDRGDHAAGGGAPVGRDVRPAHGGHGGEWYGSDMGDPSTHANTGLGEGMLGDYFIGVPTDDQTPQEHTPWVIPGSTFSEFLAGDGIDADFGGSHFLDEITTMLQEDEAACRRVQTTGTQGALDVDLNEPPSVGPFQPFALGGTPVSARIAPSHSVAGASSSRPLHVQSRVPAQPPPEDEEDEIEDEEPLIRRGHRTRVPPRCGTGSHLFR
ncbi:uncharacterized protein DS421_12g357470 [Arachis hypogaea]|nr:uncharacterized protein DS421_12g357470 [Arachis hypogaea]